MYYVVIVSLVLCMSTVKGQNACSTAQLALATTSECQQALLALAMSNGTGVDSNNAVCMDPCYSLITDVADNCPDFVSHLQLHI